MVNSNGGATTEAVILAAGLGSRIASRGVLKPLLAVAGVRLIDRTIGGLAKAGIGRVTVVTGHRSDELREALHGTAYPVQLSFAFNPEWEKPNGLSLYAARESVSGDSFVLTMTDHLFDYGIVRDLIQQGAPEEGIRLAVDERVGAVFDINDATKVQHQQYAIKDIGKHLRRYNAIDTGLFICSRSVFGEMGELMKTAAPSLSACVQSLADKGRAFAMPVGEMYWQDVDDETMLEKAESDIRKGIFE